MARQINYYDLENMCGKVQADLSTQTQTQASLTSAMNEQIELVIESVWACVEHAQAESKYTDALGTDALNYIALTKVNTNFDLDGNFMVAIPATILPFATGAQLLTAPVWTPKVTALKQV
jgi:hypothetical protein